MSTIPLRNLMPESDHVMTPRLLTVLTIVCYAKRCFVPPHALTDFCSAFVFVISTVIFANATIQFINYLLKIRQLIV
jgi:hypothetical protein